MRNSASRIRLLLVLCALVCSPCLAKCGNVRYQLTVRVLDRSSGAPVPDAQLLFFVPGHDSALRRAGSATSIGTTDDTGTFSGDFVFNTYSGWFVVDRCRAELTQLQVVVAAPNRPAERFDLRNLHSEGVGGDAPIRLSPFNVRLSPPPSVHPAW